MTVSVECGNVAENIVAGWVVRMKFIMNGYEPQNVRDTDESGCFYGTLPYKALDDMKNECHGGKM